MFPNRNSSFHYKPDPFSNRPSLQLFPNYFFTREMSLVFINNLNQ